MGSFVKNMQPFHPVNLYVRRPPNQFAFCNKELFTSPPQANFPVVLAHSSATFCSIEGNCPISVHRSCECALMTSFERDTRQA